MTNRPSHDTAADPRWARIVARDPAADGHFWYSVATTGVYCRPSCPSRAARPENVAIHDTPEEARAAGFRACRRCNPDGSSRAAENAALVEAACRTIEAAEARVPLADLASAAGLSAAHFHRLFKAQTGVTPHAYAAAHRAARVQAALSAGANVTAALFEAGFGSSARFYDAAPAMLGMAPSRYRAGGGAEELRFAVGATSLGALLVASSAAGVAAILLGDDADALVRELQDRFPDARLIGGDGAYERIVAQVAGLVEAPGMGIDLPLDIRGTAFQRRVWEALRRIPAGRTVGYAEIAARIGAPAAVRAVAGACAANAHAVAIPCHRVVRTDGALSGYRWGVERKRALLLREAG
ncbi:6-O-methylguanine DNA methyltransferase [Sphingomonas sp. Leaf412]|uniref:bifunctional DNA-binding transcriptional regulator/O6-methylguanine-DNA methyltransferase Ada n=1 Tax=Sphingomonas sp. Leaf412 TaxID=1736370 RepID=UPI0006FFE528|nr:bifunctional DNA-binding transcriptional regulator/O6-methylguanine-DNA methyltransferase Ada [Sphingomonas sp. Leaf412]KQT34959.1 6-O-methylguanine DNA methyltransferase [Sphingomonas sp. Leaf412]